MIIVGENVPLYSVDPCHANAPWFSSFQVVRLSSSSTCHGRRLMELSRVDGRERGTG